MRPPFALLLTIPIILGSTGCDTGTSTNDRSPLPAGDSTTRALADLEARIVADPDNGALYAERARFHRSVGKPDAAIADLKRALLMDSMNVRYRIELGDLYYTGLKIKEADEQFQLALKIDPTNNEATLKEAEVQVVAFRQYGKGVDLVNEALRRDPNLAQGYFIKGWAFMENHDTAKAISSYRTCVEQDPSYYQAWMELAIAHAEQHDPLSLEYYNTAIELRPQQVEAWYGKGMYCQENGMDSIALECYDRIKHLDPRNALAWYNSGYIHLEHRHDARRAVGQFTAAGKLLPSYHQAFFNRGLAYERSDVLDSAAADYQHALRIKPDYDPAAQALMRLQSKGLRILPTKK